LAPKLRHFVKHLTQHFSPKEIEDFKITGEDAIEIANEHIGKVLKGKLLAAL